MAHIDALDEQILDALQSSGRLTMKALAERVGLSSPAMIERVRRLEERGVVTGYRAVVEPTALGRSLTALIAAEVEHADHAALLQRIEAEPAVAECHRTTGSAAFLIKVHVADPSALERLLDDLSEAGARCSTSIVLSSPVPWRGITPSDGAGPNRPRATRRRRQNQGHELPAPTDGALETADVEPPTQSPSRGRGRRRSDAGG